MHRIVELWRYDNPPKKSGAFMHLNSSHNMASLVVVFSYVSLRVFKLILPQSSQLLRNVWYQYYITDLSDHNLACVGAKGRRCSGRLDWCIFIIVSLNREMVGSDSRHLYFWRKLALRLRYASTKAKHTWGHCTAPLCRIASMWHKIHKIIEIRLGIATWAIVTSSMQRP